MKVSSKIKTIYMAMLISTLFLLQCKKNANLSGSEHEASFNAEATSTIEPMPCGQTMTQTLLAGQTIKVGNVTVSNDQNNLYVTYQAQQGWQIQRTHLYVGDWLFIPTNPSGNPQIGLFPYQTTHHSMVTTVTYTLPLASFTTSCYCVAACAEVALIKDNVINQLETAWAQGTSIAGNRQASKFTYCTQTCTTQTCIISPGDYLTIMQGGWGVTPDGGNPGAYLQSNLQLAYLMTYYLK